MSSAKRQNRIHSSMNETIEIRMTCLRQATATLLSHGQTHCAVKCRELQDLLDAGEAEFGWNAADAVGIVGMLIEEHRERSTPSAGDEPHLPIELDDMQGL
jgi:hypothetical protein